MTDDKLNSVITNIVKTYQANPRLAENMNALKTLGELISGKSPKLVKLFEKNGELFSLYKA
jgi:hypothetical protein